MFTGIGNYRVFHLTVSRKMLALKKEQLNVIYVSDDIRTVFVSEMLQQT